MSIIVYGIPNCDTVKKARRWLTERGVDYSFHDYKKLGIDAARLQDWVRAVGWETLINRRGTTWRKLPEADRADLDQTRAVALMAANPSLVKRPVVELDDNLLVGFCEADWRQSSVGASWVQSVTANRHTSARA